MPYMIWTHEDEKAANAEGWSMISSPTGQGLWLTGRGAWPRTMTEVLGFMVKDFRPLHKRALMIIMQEAPEDWVLMADHLAQRQKMLGDLPEWLLLEVAAAQLKG